MKEFKGTPGPWKANVYLFSKRVNVEASDVELISVGSADQERNLHNAYLIAAAPDMFNALQEIIALANSRGSQVVKDRMIIAEAEAALDKVLGEDK